MQFHFPQYIDIEDKIFGPLTLKQAIYVAGGIGAAYVAFTYIQVLFISVPVIAGIGVLTWALAFYPKEKLGRPFIEVLEAGFYYAMSGKLYTWKKTTREPSLGKEENFLPAQPAITPVIPQGKLSSSSFNIDVRGTGRENEQSEREELSLAGQNRGGLAGSASAEAGTISADSFVLQQKIPKVDTFVVAEKTEHSPYKQPSPSQGMSGTRGATGAMAGAGTVPAVSAK